MPRAAGSAGKAWRSAWIRPSTARPVRTDHEGDLTAPKWALAELIEAAARSGDNGTAAGALARLAGMTSAARTDWALGIEARCRALLSEGEAAERLYRESVERLARTRLRPDLARAYLLYGEWLRRERRRTEAREQLRTAHGMLRAMGMEAFAERARGELQATGETARRRPAAAGIDELTAHEAQIARLARDGLTNPEIGARLFLSARTVQYHLGNVSLWDSDTDYERFRDERLVPALSGFGRVLPTMEMWPIQTVRMLRAT